MCARRLNEDVIVLATHNAGKAAELSALLAPYGITLKTLTDFGLPAPAETGGTFLENAAIKAQAAAQATGLPALADDSGFCVAALGGAPGVRSAEWAEISPGGARDYAGVFEKIHAALAPGRDPGAAFCAVLALAWPDGHLEHAEGRITGRFTYPPRGDQGFGYDPVFVPDGQTQTFAELGPAFKAGHSHRARALAALMAACRI